VRRTLDDVGGPPHVCVETGVGGGGGSAGTHQSVWACAVKPQLPNVHRVTNPRAFDEGRRGVRPFRRQS